MNSVCPKGHNIPAAGARINNDFSQQEKIPFGDISREEHRDDTKSLRGLLTTCDILVTNSDGARTGHNKSSSGKPATKSDRDWMEKVSGRERTAVSVYAKNSGTYETAAAEEEKDTIRERACSSLTLLTDARVTKKKKKSTESNPGGRTDAKDQRPETEDTPTPSNIPRRRSNRSSRCFPTTSREAPGKSNFPATPSGRLQKSSTYIPKLQIQTAY